MENENEQTLGKREDAMNEPFFMVYQKEIDSVVMNVLQKFVERSKFGKSKYGCDLDRNDLGVLDWIQHAQEEHMDAILYLEKLKREVKVKRDNVNISNCACNGRANEDCEK